MRKISLLALPLFACCSIAHSSAEAEQAAKPFSYYETSGFGVSDVAFSDAVLSLPWEGPAVIAKAELLNGVAADRITLDVKLLPDPIIRKLGRNIVSIVSGRGRLDPDGSTFHLLEVTSIRRVPCDAWKGYFCCCDLPPPPRGDSRSSPDPTSRNLGGGKQ